jgi:hypothetical protein
MEMPARSRQPTPRFSKSGKRDSNPRPQPWQGCALPTELFPHTTYATVTPNNLSGPHRPHVRTLPGPRRHGGEGNRTPDLLNAIQALSQLSYAPGATPSPPKAAARASGTAKTSEVYVGRQATSSGFPILQPLAEAGETPDFPYLAGLAPDAPRCRHALSTSLCAGA